ncbi:polyphosphate:AMP phosphotransferase [Kushneria aurantia]|uniref:Polyphosphate:AMP phosphotransferase n=1 Tax=Kushneria aurantia TaxID=504092 RepID=A0ABV6G572_9GAMM|nr:polyphosphate:AMP phosphotransferase [Kushneria aurantia]
MPDNHDQPLDKACYRQQATELRERLLEAQFEMRQRGDFPVLILIAGFEVAGKGESVKLLHEWLDPRHLRVDTFGEFTDELHARPAAWSYWQRLPSKGHIGIFFLNWYTRLLRARVNEEVDEQGFEQQLDDIRRLETMLAHEGVVLLKLWFHLSRAEMKARLEAQQHSSERSWRLTPLEWHQLDHYDTTRRHAEQMLAHTRCRHANWTVIDCADPRRRNLAVGRALLDAMRCGPAKGPPLPALSQGGALPPRPRSEAMKRKDYKRERNREQRRLLSLMRKKRMRRHAVVAVFEGNDAAGKGGSIRRVTDALDPREYRIVPIAAPSQEALAHPWLWRFWQQLPRLGGRMTIFDRSWYGRVLVERVEGLCTPADWQRAFEEINDFEAQLAEAGIIVVKFWLAIDSDTQLARFRAREASPLKRYKITDEDWRNRGKWDDYATAVGDMVARTSTDTARWTVIDANDKRHARVAVLKTLNDAIERAFAKDRQGDGQ